MQTINKELTFLSLQDENQKLSSEKLTEFLEKNIKSNLEQNIIYFVGDGTLIYKELIENIELKNKYKIEIAKEGKNIASGITLAQVGYTKYKNGQYGDSSILSPVYLRKSQAELNLEEKGAKK